MGTWNAFYIRRNTSDSAVESAVRAWFPKAHIEVGPTFLGVLLEEEEYLPPEDLLASLSSKFETEVIWLSFQSVVDAFQFYHWRGGKGLRALVFGCFEKERTWERVDGESEPWEYAVFFDGKISAPSPACMESSEEEKEPTLPHETHLIVGSTNPRLDARVCAREIALYYGLPGF